MIDCIYYNDTLRCYRNGVVERYWKRKGWTIVENTGNKDGYNQLCINNKMIKRHRIIAFCFLGLRDIVGELNKSNVIDHIDGNILNNCVANLRITNNTGNAHNRKNVKGYWFDKSSQKWRAKIMINNKPIHLGYYNTEEEAHEAYLVAKRKYHIF